VGTLGPHVQRGGPVSGDFSKVGRQGGWWGLASVAHWHPLACAALPPWAALPFICLHVYDKGVLQSTAAGYGCGRPSLLLVGVGVASCAQGVFLYGRVSFFFWLQPASLPSPSSTLALAPPLPAPPMHLCANVAWVVSKGLPGLAYQGVSCAVLFFVP
jgi:hypothetical protein